MKRAYSVKNVMDAKFKTLKLGDKWQQAVGTPEMTGTWMIYGAPKNGKTTFAMMLGKYLTGFGRVAYDSVEEGLSLTIKRSLERVEMASIGSRFIILDKEGVEELTARLRRPKSPDIVIIDSVQFMDLRFMEYKALKKQFPHKLFIYISHVKGISPDGQAAKRIWRDANVYFRVEGYRAFPVSRYGGGEAIDIWPSKAAEYWGMKEETI